MLRKRYPDKDKFVFSIFVISVMMFCSYIFPYLFSLIKIPVLIPRVTIIGVPFLIALIVFLFWNTDRRVVLVVSVLYLFASSYMVLSHNEIKHYKKKEEIRRSLNFIEKLCNKKRTKTILYSYSWAYLNAYSSMLKKKLKFFYPCIADFFKDYRALREGDAIIIVYFHDFSKNIPENVFKYIKQMCTLENIVHFYKVKIEIYKVHKELDKGKRDIINF